MGFIAGQSFGVIPVETTHFGVGFGRVEMSHCSKWPFREDSGSVGANRAGAEDAGVEREPGKLLASALEGSGKQNVDAEGTELPVL